MRIIKGGTATEASLQSGVNTQVVLHQQEERLHLTSGTVLQQVTLTIQRVLKPEMFNPSQIQNLCLLRQRRMVSVIVSN